MTSGDDVRFAALVGARRIWAVAAIHGDVERLARLHDQLQRQFGRGDRLVYLGNYLGHDSRLRGVIDELLLFRRALLARFTLFKDDIVYLRGSQEEMWQKLLQLHIARDPAQVLEWMLAHGVGETLKAYGASADSLRLRCREGAQSLARWSGGLRESVRANAGHEELFGTLRRAAFDDGGNLLFVHAGIDVTRPLSAQTDSFWWGAGDFATITQPYEGFQRIVRGFDPSHGGVAIGPIAATIDGGCGFGGPLCAVCFAPTGAVEERIEA
ncbi:MAG: hypothetical protein QF926_05120 [Alphaproteobacteria bacterium]|jgi:serine/threonine protein phosphatase 1|nr:hypothetical protein [Alphaproteobacteria bacterium]MDP6515992.1 hypothetical protein [Alphaproteobacteria bacterium]